MLRSLFVCLFISIVVVLLRHFIPVHSWFDPYWHPSCRIMCWFLSNAKLARAVIGTNGPIEKWSQLLLICCSLLTSLLDWPTNHQPNSMLIIDWRKSSFLLPSILIWLIKRSQLAQTENRLAFGWRNERNIREEKFLQNLYNFVLASFVGFSKIR